MPIRTVRTSGSRSVGRDSSCACSSADSPEAGSRDHALSEGRGTLGSEGRSPPSDPGDPPLSVQRERKPHRGLTQLRAIPENVKVAEPLLLEPRERSQGAILSHPLPHSVPERSREEGAHRGSEV